MTYPLSDEFNDPAGRWDQFAPWDATEASESVKGFLTTQKHVDIRSFRVIEDFDPRPQTELQAPVTQTQLDAETQTDMELKPAANVADENWILSGSGMDPIVVGEVSGRGGWSALTSTTSGGPVDVLLTSSITTPIDITPGTDFSMIMPDYSAWDIASSRVTLTSDPNGVFGNGYDSTNVFFNQNTSAMPEFRFPLSLLPNGLFDPTKVTGVQIRLHNAVDPGAGHAFTLMAIRSLDPAWVESWLDFDTRIGAICVPVTLDGNPYGGTVAQAFEFVRGDETKEDPIPADLAMNAYFYPGGFTIPNDATGLTYNKIAFIMREVKDTGAGTGSHIECGLTFNDTNTNFYANFVSTTGGSPGTEVITGSYTTSVGPPLDNTKRYLLSVQLKGTQIIPTLYSTYTDKSVRQQEWQPPSAITNSAYVYRNGRVGFIADLFTRDAYVDALEVAPQGFAELVTQPYNSRTPVDGAQLAAVYASDLNLWTGMSGIGLVTDTNKTISGNGSYRTSGQMKTNDFLADDWTQMYLQMAIWVSSAVTVDNQPQILLNVPGGIQLGNPTISIASPGVVTLASHGLKAGDTVYFTTTGALPSPLSPNTTYYVISSGLTTNQFEIATSFGGTAINTSGTQSGIHTLVKNAPEQLFPGALKPAQWNDLYFDLGVFRNLLTGAANYSFTIQPGAAPDRPLGLYWVDSMVIGRRRVAWAVRTSSSNPWREFKEAVNNPNGAVHFPHDERGTALQLRADALTDDAWVSSFHLFPRYAQLGLPLFDEGGTYENFASGQ